MNNKKQLVVIGAGPGGYAAAFHAADLGMGVTLIDPAGNPGGVCLYRGCIPSKALLHVSKLLAESKEAKNWGIEFQPPKIDLDKLRSWKDGVVTKLTGGLGQLTKRRKIEYIRGKARFIDNSSLDVTLNDGSSEEVKFENAIIATGSHPTVISAFNIGSPRIMNSTTALELKDVPKSLLVIGGGYIGLELGTVYQALGSEVTVVEMLPDILTGADKDLASVLKRRLKKEFRNILLKTTVKSLIEKKDGIHVEFEGNKLDGVDTVFDKVLVSVGRKPNSSSLDLENTGVQIDQKGFIRIDDQRRTDDPGIWAIGDVAGEPMLAHKASHEGRTAVEAIAEQKVAFEPNAIPAVVFTDPEIAWCGLTELEAKAQNRKVEVSKFPWAASGRALSIDRTDGLTKLIIDPDTKKILGMGIVGAGAGEMIAEGVLAIEMAALADDISLTIHPHPTLSETIMEAADVFLGHSTHVYRPKRK